MAREKKTQIIESLSEAFSKCSIGILTNYQGLPGNEMTLLRRKLGEAGIDYKVVKNTMARLAAEKAGKKKILNSFVGPVAIAFGYGGVTETAKVLAESIRTVKENLSVKGGFLGDRPLTVEEVTTLFTLPSREVLLAQVVGGVQSPIVTLISYLSSPLRGIIGVLQARIQQLEGEQDARK